MAIPASVSSVRLAEHWPSVPHGLSVGTLAAGACPSMQDVCHLTIACLGEACTGKVRGSTQVKRQHWQTLKF